jgi:hypothetical protein
MQDPYQDDIHYFDWTRIDKRYKRAFLENNDNNLMGCGIICYFGKSIDIQAWLSYSISKSMVQTITLTTIRLREEY